MICPKCNSNNPDGINFCQFCGAAISNNEATVSVNGGSVYYSNNKQAPNQQYQEQPNYQQAPNQQYQGQPNYQQPPYQQYQGQPNYQQPPYQGNNGKAPIARRDIAIAIILSFVTCGIYGIYWFVNLVNDLNTASDSAGDTSGGIVFLLSLVTCGIYGIYWFYNAGKKVDYISKKYNGTASDNSIVYLLLAIFGFGIVNFALIQNELNKVAAN